MGGLSTVAADLVSSDFRRSGAMPMYVVCGILVATGTNGATSPPAYCTDTPFPSPELQLPQICFPSDAKIRRYTGGTPATVTMEDLVIGDTVDCLKPQDAAGDGVLTSWVAGRCDVYYYFNARNNATLFEYINMAYTAADGSAAVYRVSPNHGVFTVTTAIPATTPLAVPGLGTPKPARLVKVGDLLAVRNSADQYYTAAVTALSLTNERGAYAPLLTDGGVMIIDNIASVSFSGNGIANTQGQPFLYTWYWFTPVYQVYLRSFGCSGGTACECMDAAPTSIPEYPLGCVRRQQALRDSGTALSWYRRQLMSVGSAAQAAGRTRIDVAGFVRAYRAKLTANKVFTWEEGKQMYDEYLVYPPPAAPPPP